MVPCNLDITYTISFDATIIKYKLELTPAGKKIGYNLLDENMFTVLYILDKIPNSTDIHQLPTQAKNNLCVVAINGEEPIIEKEAFY